MDSDSVPTPQLEAHAWPSTRAEGLRRLAAFVPRAGRAYAQTRNEDRGPDDRSNVSVLGPYLRARLVTEEEVLAAVLAVHARSSAEKFISEVFWRTYWKGWLEAHADGWRRYRSDLAERWADVERDPDLAARFAAARAGGTGLPAFDTWVHELDRTGYLHNHARMWFASIWIFTLRLPWELGADHFMQRLLCGDPASNVLSWRWVAGLHTRGKTYLALRSNIRRYTGERLDPGPELASRAPAVATPAYPPAPPRPVPLAVADPGPALLLLHDDDAGHESLPLGPLTIRTAFGIVTAASRSPQGVRAAVERFAHGAVADALSRVAGGPHPIGDNRAAPDESAAAIAERAKAAGVRLAVAPFAPVGPVRETLDALREPLRARGIRLAELGRRYDALAWPHATRGFFGLRAHIPAILDALELGTPAQSDSARSASSARDGAASGSSSVAANV